MEFVDQRQLAKQMPFLSSSSDVLMAVGVVFILIFMIIPLPPFVLDLLLSFSITVSLVILLVSMYVLKPLDLSSFPSILLIATLFRLALNIASTRIILLHGHEGGAAAGKVIQSFGAFVVGGNTVVGIIVFLILVIINFLVITKGAGRIAEVAARFTLDAMPGKQMSIDADLNAGLINEDEAKRRRETIAREAEYYGAMDGANKFVRGDAIAGIVITLINIMGGLSVGLLQNGMGFTEAAQTYTLLTVGDGLVSQIPALVVSTATGILVSRAGADASLGDDIAAQVLVQPRAIGIAAVVIFGFALVPGLPTLPFMILASMAAGLAYVMHQATRRAEADKELQQTEQAVQPVESVITLPPLDIIGLEVGYGLIPLVDAAQNGALLEHIKSVRRQFASDIGIIIAPIHIQDNIQLKPGEYAILLKGNEVGRGELMPNNYLAMDPGTAEESLDGLTTTEPTYGLPALWIKETEREEALRKGYTVVDPAAVLTTHLSDIVRRHAHELLGRQEVQHLLDHVKESYPKVVDELVPNLLPLGVVVKVLQNLLREQIPIRDMLAILETLADWSPMTRDPRILTEYVRQALARTITKMHLSDDGVIAVLTLGQHLESTLRDAVPQSEQSGFLVLDPLKIEKIVSSLEHKLDVFIAANARPVVICSAKTRSALKQLTDRFIPDLAVLSYDEIIPSAQIQSLGVVELMDAD